MKTNNDMLPDVDEVQRCRQVRRALEKKYGTLDGLCQWLKKLEAQEKTHSQPSKRRQVRGSGPKTRKE
jgi:hypothetical protein